MQRTEMMERVRSHGEWDVIVVGGGATGLGTAIDAASRGFSTLLLEGVDYGKGTSSRSTKLVHGGVRYLAQGDVKLVFEALHERGLLLRNAPHLAHPLPFVVPGYTWWSNPYYGLGLTLYSLLAGNLGIKFSRIVSKKKALELVPTLEPEGLRGGIVYWDGQFDDTRLLVSMLRTVLDEGGVALNYTPVTGLIKENGRVVGVNAFDGETGQPFEARGKAIVNATGVYADGLRKMDQPGTKPMLSPSQGVHIVLDRSFLPGDHAIMIPKTDDGRVLFAIPWNDRVVVGTTDTAVDGVSQDPQPMDKEVQFLLTHTARYLSKDPQPEDVLSVFAGLRPLVKAGDDGNTAALSRDHTLVVSPAKLITITGGKWTTYRNMAQDTVNRAIEVGGLPDRPCKTQSLKLHGYSKEPAAPPLAVYGSDVTELRQLMAQNPEWDQLLHPNLPYRVGEVVWATRYEMARTVEDVLARRTRALLLDAQASSEIAPHVAELMADELGFDQEWQDTQVKRYRELARGYQLSPKSTEPEEAQMMAV